jgi:DNA-binding transcriptional MerR regulator
VTEYRVTELARAAGTTVRNVRVYQDRGLLAPPRREGRIGLYDESHLDQLKLIGRLLGRGYTFATIRELFEAWSGGQDLAATLGLRKPARHPSRLTGDELSLRFGVAVPAEARSRLVRLGVLVEDGPEYLVLSAEFVDAGTQLVAVGVPLEAVLELAEGQQADLVTMAERSVGVLMAHRAAGEALAEPARRLRPLMDALFGIALQQETDRLLAPES